MRIGESVSDLNQDCGPRIKHAEERDPHLSQFKQFLAQPCQLSERLVDVVLADRLVVRGCLLRTGQQVGSADGFLELDSGFEERVAESLWFWPFESKSRSGWGGREGKSGEG